LVESFEQQNWLRPPLLSRHGLPGQSAAWLTQNGLLHPTLTRQLKPGSRIVTNFVAGSMKEWKPDRVDHYADASGTTRAIIYVWKTTAAP